MGPVLAKAGKGEIVNEPLEIVAAEEFGEEGKEVFDFNSPEDVLIEVIHLTDEDWEIETCTIIRGKEGVTGAASYEHSFGAGLDWTISQIIDRPPEGWHVVIGVTAVFTRGDGYTTDDDMDFYFETVRPATDEEKAMA